MHAGRSVGVPRIVTVEQQLRNDERRWRGMFATLIVFTLMAAWLNRGLEPDPFTLAVVVLVLASLAAFVRPTVGVYLIVFLTLVGDYYTMEWWPFTKNLSSRESILFVNDLLFITPLELLAGVTTLAWLMRQLVDPTWGFHRGRMFTPIVVLTAFVLLGVVRGKAAGGDTRAAIFEFRPLLYLVLMYFLITNLLTTRRQYYRLLLVGMVAVSIQSVFSLVYYQSLPTVARDSLEALTEHSATIHMNALFVLTLAAWLFKGRGLLRWSLIVLSVPVVWAYMLSQRRAAMVAFIVGLAALVVILFWRRRRAFWFFTPTALILGIGYVGATWNAGGAIGLPAAAVKTVLFPGQLTEEESGSNLYRVIEGYDLWFTIRSSPITGLGFGQRFYTPIALPDISTSFEFWNYLPHNSVLWMWIKTGFLGFVAMLFLFARAVQLGARSALSVRTPPHVAVVVTGLAYVVMFLVFAYVDVAWNPRTTVFLAFALAICGDFVGAIYDQQTSPEGVHTRQLESVVR